MCRRPSWAPALAVLVVALTLACVYPLRRGTGIEFSWRFLESNLVDGDEGRRYRTCPGAGVSQVLLEVTDDDEEDREHVFVYECEEGYQTLREFQQRASDVFVVLKPGSYGVELRAVREDGSTVIGDTESFVVDDHGVTVQGWEIETPTVSWTLELTGSDACSRLALALRYADPEAAVAELDQDVATGTDTGTGGAEPGLVYRASLTSDRGLSLGGEDANCEDAAGSHLFEAIDEGAYVLDIARDEESCSLPVVIDRDHGQLALDLSGQPC